MVQENSVASYLATPQNRGIRMKYEVGDWIVVQNGKKAVIARVKDEQTCFLKDFRESPYVLDITPSNLLCNLGAKLPPHKTIFGASTNAYRTSLEIEGQEVRIFTGAIKKETVIKTISKAINRVSKIADCLLPVVIEVYAGKGIKQAEAKFDKGHAVIRWYTDDGLYDEEVWLHEFGHILFDQLPSSVKGYWVRKYCNLVKVSEADKQMYLTCKKDLIDNGPTFFKQLEPEYKEIANVIFDWIKKYRGLTIRDLQDWYESGWKKEVDNIFPTSVQIKKFVDVEDEYSLKNVDEFFAVNFARYHKKLEIQKSVSELMKKTINYAKLKISREENEE